MSRLLCFAAVAAVCVSSSAFATDVLHASFTDDAGPNMYRVVFPPELGSAVIEMKITGGGFDLQLDPQTLTASLSSWIQEIDPIDIYGASTGVITVTLDETKPATGTYTPANGEFSVTGTFILTFDDSQLQALGFVSPFVMTATENGLVTADRQIHMFLTGEGTFANGKFSYTCQTSSTFDYPQDPSRGQPGDVNRDARIDIADPINALQFLFLGKGAACPGAIDVNGDAKRDIADPVYVLEYLFLGGQSTPVFPVDCLP